MSNLDTVKDDLVPVFTANIGGELVKACDARALHTYLQNSKQFANWIKDRIEKYKFVENQDFVINYLVKQLPSGAKHIKDYHLTLDMAKELAMVENNARGREARRYFIEQAKTRVACYGLNVGDCEYRLNGAYSHATIECTNYLLDADQ